ncbi:MAG: carbon starvation protein A [Bacteroidetes bacterium]|nr:carbon starvation protein A [Bacteroidota bacterium]
MNSIPLVLGALAFFALAYRFYFGFIAAKIAVANDLRHTPAHRLYDGQNYYPMNKFVLFGHHFAAIAGAGPLVGPVLATQFGYFPGFLWMVIGAVVAGAVHDYIILVASIRYDGKSLAEIAKEEISKLSGTIASIAILIILIIAMAGLGLVVVNALAESAWGVFTIAATIPIAVLMGLWMFQFRKGKVAEATIGGVILLVLAVIYGKYVPESSVASWFLLDHKTLALLLALYGFLASVLPVWLLLSPRDYLSSIMKLGVVAMLAIGVIIVAPDLKMPAFTKYIQGGGPIVPGTLFPYLFITIACGAISGFHSLVSSGTTPKMLMRESDMKFITVGAMLSEGFVSVLALIAASSLLPLDYFLINVPADKIQNILPELRAMGFTESNIETLTAEVGETIVGRTGGAVSLAVGMAQIFSSIPGLTSLMSYWYHFAIMFEALFILTTIDAGTRIGRFILQEAMGRIYAPLGRANWLPGNLFASFLVVFAWAYFIYTGTVTTIWPMFGTANQLLAAVALTVGTTYIVNRGKARYAWVTLLPLVFIAITTLSAGTLNIVNLFIPQILHLPTRVQGTINCLLTIIIMGCVVIVLANAIPQWISVIRGRKPIVQER